MTGAVRFYYHEAGSTRHPRRHCFRSSGFRWDRLIALAIKNGARIVGYGCEEGAMVVHFRA